MTRNRPIYHCQCCGSVIVQDPFRAPPFCCHQEMTKAGEETLRDDFAHEWSPEPCMFDEFPFAPHWCDRLAEHALP